MWDHRKVSAEVYRRRLGGLVEQRRNEMSLSQPAVGGTSDTYRRLRDGLAVRSQTLRAAEQALGLEPLSLDRVLSGADLSLTPKVERHDRNGRDLTQRRLHLIKMLNRSAVGIDEVPEDVLDEAERLVERLIMTLGNDKDSTT